MTQPPPHGSAQPDWTPQPGAPTGWNPPPTQATQWGPPPHGGQPQPQWGAPPPQWGPPPMWAPPPKPPMLPVVAREYPAFWRAPGIKAWRPIVAIILGAIGFLVSSLIVTLGAFFLEAWITGGNVGDALLDLTEGIATSTFLLANSVSLGLLVPLSFLLSRLVGQKGGWMSSVMGRVRWGWLMKCFLVSLIAVGGLIVFSATFEGWDQLELSARPGWWWLLIGIILVTPFQAAGEEYLIRGVLNRGVASLVPPRLVGAIVGAVVSSFVFMLLHDAGDIWLNVNYFSMGMLFSYLVWRTGGLEAAVAMHAANNLVGFAFVPFQDISDLFDRGAGTGGPIVLIQMVVLGAAAAVIVLMARRGGVERASAPAATRSLVPTGPGPMLGSGSGLS